MWPLIYSFRAGAREKIAEIEKNDDAAPELSNPPTITETTNETLTAAECEQIFTGCGGECNKFKLFIINYEILTYVSCMPFYVCSIVHTRRIRDVAGKKFCRVHIRTNFRINRTIGFSK